MVDITLSSQPGKGSRIAARLLTELVQRTPAPVNQADGPEDDDATQATQDMEPTPCCQQQMDMRTLLEGSVVTPLVQHVWR